MSVTRMTSLSFGSTRRTVDRDRRTRLAERVGFEPADHIAAINALAGRPIRPLWHLSWEPRSVARYPRSRNGGRVDECSRLESGRPQGSGVRIPPVPPMGFNGELPKLIQQTDSESN